MIIALCGAIVVIALLCVIAHKLASDTQKVARHMFRSH